MHSSYISGYVKGYMQKQAEGEASPALGAQPMPVKPIQPTQVQPIEPVQPVQETTQMPQLNPAQNPNEESNWVPQAGAEANAVESAAPGVDPAVAPQPPITVIPVQPPPPMNPNIPNNAGA